MIMANQNSVQDVVRCTACKNALVPMYCEVCNIDLCKDCIEEHITDQSKIHRVVSRKQFLVTAKCPDHLNQHCELHCEQCLQCVVSKKHDSARFMANCQRKQEVSEKDLEKLPKVSLPNVESQEMNRKKLLKPSGSLSTLSTEKEDYISISQRRVSSPQNRRLLDVPQIITEISVGKRKKLYGVGCLSDEEIWTHGKDKILKLYNLKGEIMRTVKTKSGNTPMDITVTRSRELVYTDYKERSINLESNKMIQPLIRLRGWRPRGVCSTSSSELLVIMDNDDNTQTKVVRYSGTEERQTIQQDEQERPLYSSSFSFIYLTENINLDICVADNGANAVVVVSAAGKFRFRYTGRPSDNRKFFPYVINKDSQGRILTAEKTKNRIHIIDQDGQFLRYIDQCGLLGPFGLCLDSSDNIFVTEYSTGKVKKIKFCK